MNKSINIESNSIIGEYRKKVLLEIERLDKNLINLSSLYGIEASCLSSWKQTFLDTLWSIFSAMVPVKLCDLREKECVLIQPCVRLSDQRCSFLPGNDGESFIHPASAISVNTVSPLYRRSTASFLKKRCGKYVPLLRLSGEWLLNYGFEIGKKYETYANKNQLILKIGGCIGNGNGNGRGINSDNDNDNNDTDKNRNVADGIGGANG